MARCRPVTEYDLDGNKIKDWSSVLEAGTAYNCDSSMISGACNPNKRNYVAVGRRWAYFGEPLKPLPANPVRSLPGEIWRLSIYPNYAVSNLGRVKRLASLSNGPRSIYVAEKLLVAHEFTPNPSDQSSFEGNYLYVVIGRKNVSIHRLVAEAFLPNPNNLPIVNHKDCNRQNNNVSNLEWCTYSHNTRHAIAAGRMICSDHNHMVKMAQAAKQKVKKQIMCVETNTTYPSINECAKSLGLKLSKLYERTSKHPDGFEFQSYHFKLVNRKG